MRITAGEFKGRRLTAPSVVGLRPTPAKVRQALFNIIPPLLPAATLHKVSMLDLFSGSGIMAVEALSRGVDAVVSCEQDAKAIRAMQGIANTLTLPAIRWQWVKASLPHALKALEHRHFTWVFADPPYRQGITEKIPLWLQDHGISCDLLVVEEASDVVVAWSKSKLTLNMTRRYGNTSLHFLQ